MALLSDHQLQEFTASYPEWGLAGDRIVRSFRFADFVEAMGFVTRVGLMAERAFHHPDIDIRWNTVTLTLSTHSEGGVTGKDLDLAAAISAIA